MLSFSQGYSGCLASLERSASLALASIGVVAGDSPIALLVELLSLMYIAKVV